MIVRRGVSVLVPWIAAAGIALSAGPAGAVSITGTISYTGNRGPVSETRPILIFVFEDPFFRNVPVTKATVSSDGGTFELAVPGTNYLAYVLDVNGDGEGSVGEPGEVFSNRAGLPADPIALPRALVLSFDDTLLISGIAGTATYNGAKGPVSDSRRIIVEPFADAELTQPSEPRLRGTAETNGGPYHLSALDTDTYYLRAFFDVNGNFRFDLGEPFEIYSGQLTPPADGVVASPTQTAINFEFGDENALCVGDCAGDVQVTVDELLTMVNIALGEALVTDCEAGDGNRDGEITIDEILTAVNNALGECS